MKGGPETEKHRHCQLTGRHWTRYGNIREHRVNANSQGREGGREGGGGFDSYLAGTWRWNAAGPRAAPGDTADIFRLKLGFC